jgi:ATP-dependent DNA helicase RecQ
MVTQSPETVLQQVFGFEAFRDGQSEAIKALMNGESACVVFPTGAGKSICYQLPGILFEKLTIVVCPLIALMKDQVEFLKSKNVQAEFFNSTLDKDQTAQFFERLKRGQIKILYVAPERFRNERFMENMVNVQVDMLAIDESHCISEWGHAFRPDYLLLKKAAMQLNVKRILCCTATGKA